MEKIRVGVFGADRGRVFMNVLLRHPDAELVAVCEKNPPLLKRAGELAAEHGQNISLYESFDDFITHPMDAVVLVNYANEHVPYAIRAMEAGMHVLSEVLACETMAQAVELIEAVERTGKVYAYAENYCYMAHTFEMWRRYRRGDIGEITYGEGEYIHDTASIIPQITQGDPTHWRYRQHPFFYCTHSFGPLVTITGLRPKSVMGIKTRSVPEFYTRAIGCGHAGIEMVTLENGAVIKSIHGRQKREPSSVNYEVYGAKGCMESQRFGEPNLNVYIEGDTVCKGTLETYIPEKFIAPELAASFDTHNGSDFYPTHFFLQRILDRPEGHEYSIDVYTAVDMTIVGILAYRSQLQGGAAIEVPNLRDKAARDKWRDDNACTNPAVAGDQLLPVQHDYDSLPPVPPESYEHIRRLYEAGSPYEKYSDIVNQG